jgi:hypothetical protein
VGSFYGVCCCVPGLVFPSILTSTSDSTNPAMKHRVPADLNSCWFTKYSVLIFTGIKDVHTQNILCANISGES